MNVDSPIAEVHVGEILDRFWRRRGLFLAAFLPTILLCATGILLLPKLYTAQSTVMIDPREHNITDIKSVVGGAPDDMPTVASEAAVFRSREALHRVVDEFRLIERDEFIKGILQRGGLLDKIGSLLWRGDDPAVENADPRMLAVNEAVEVVAKRLGVKESSKSRVVEVTFFSEDPVLAAAVTNRLVELYLERQIAEQPEQTRSAHHLLDDRAFGLRSALEEAERTVERFRTSSILGLGRDPEFLTRQTSDIASNLAEAENRTWQAKAEMNAAESALRRRGPVGILDLVGSSITEHLLKEEAVLSQRLTTTKLKLGPDHPAVRELEAERADINAHISRQAETRLSSLRAHVSMAEQQTALLRADLDRLNQEKAEVNKAEIQLRALQREADAQRMLLETFLRRAKETEQIGIERASAWVVSKAEPPTRASKPRRLLLLAGAVVLAAVVGAILVQIAEMLRLSRFVSLDQIGQDLALATHGIVPMVKGKLRFAGLKSSGSPKQIDPAFGAAIQRVAAGAGFWMHQNGCLEPILFTSALPREGKTTIATSFAVSLAGKNRNILLIDADLRRPRVHQLLGMNNEIGLSDIFCEDRDTDIRSLCRPTRHAGLSVITAGPPLPADSPHPDMAPIARFIGSTIREFDLVIIDAPPVLPVPDALVLASMFKHTIFVIRWNGAKRRAINHAVDHLIRAGASISGVVLNAVNINKLAKMDCTEAHYLRDRSYRRYLERRSS